MEKRLSSTPIEYLIMSMAHFALTYYEKHNGKGNAIIELLEDRKKRKAYEEQYNVISQISESELDLIVLLNNQLTDLLKEYKDAKSKGHI